MRYAEHTAVAPERSRAEIERILARCGATAFAYGWSAEGGSIAFQLQGRAIRFTLPTFADDGGKTPTGRVRHNAAAREKAREQAIRQRWRALYLVIRAKLEAVQAGIVSFEEEFLAQTVLPDGRTVGDWALPQIGEAVADGKMPALLLTGRTP